MNRKRRLRRLQLLLLPPVTQTAASAGEVRSVTAVDAAVHQVQTAVLPAADDDVVAVVTAAAAAAEAPPYQ